jgi:hypothetical protein
MAGCDLNHNRSKWKDTELLRTDPGVKTNRSSSRQTQPCFFKLEMTTFFGLKNHHLATITKTLK